MPQTRTVITGTGSYIPPHIKTNSEFALQEFYSEDNERIVAPPNEIAEKVPRYYRHRRKALCR
jgi:3-oxoacyl-[acyl-carrier-protein] synthase-3